MTIEGILESLSDEAARSLRGVLKKAYEQGYREGLAAAGSNAPAPALQPPPVASESAPRVAPLPPPPEDDIDWTDEIEDASQGEDDEEEEDSLASSAAAGAEGPRPVTWDESEAPAPADAAAAAPRPIGAGATIGTLRRRIFKNFALERFAIDVIVCRKGDKDRRQLKSNVRLSKYFVPGVR